MIFTLIFYDYYSLKIHFKYMHIFNRNVYKIPYVLII